MTNIFEDRLKQTYSSNPKPGQKNPYNNPFEERASSSEFQEKHAESGWKSFARNALQIPQGIAEGTATGIISGMAQLLGNPDIDIDEWHKLRQIAEENGQEFDEEAFQQARHEAAQTFPTVSNIARKVEEETGLPLEAKTASQKFLRLGSTAGKLQAGTASQKATASVVAPTTSAVLKATGVPEPISDIVGLGAGSYAGYKTPQIDVGKSQKTSGLTERQFEKVTSPKEISESKMNQINEKVKADFKEISDQIIAESPIGETASNLKNDPTFKQQSRELLDEAQNIANETSETIKTNLLKKEIKDISLEKPKGFSLNEYDKSYSKYMKEAEKDIISEEATYGQLVEQYRKNNRSLEEYFEPGASKALNRAKRDSILDQNRAIANVMEKGNPELSNVFKEGNARWTKIMDAEAIDNFVNEIFEKGINYKKMHDFFDKNGFDRVFKKALGEKGFNQFEQLIKDGLTSEVPYKMLKVAQKKGYDELAKSALSFIIHPNLGAAKIGYDAAKSTFKTIVNFALDKPKFVLTWKDGLNKIKKGDFKGAEPLFEELQEELSKKNLLKEESRKKFLEKINHKKGS